MVDALHGQASWPQPRIDSSHLAAFSLASHRSETFKLSKDPLFIDTVRDIVGLYLAPPERALVLCVDEKARYKPWTPKPVR